MGGAPAISPKLLELDKEDVRSFLPGKVLERKAALFLGAKLDSHEPGKRAVSMSLRGASPRATRSKNP